MKCSIICDVTCEKVSQVSLQLFEEFAKSEKILFPCFLFIHLFGNSLTMFHTTKWHYNSYFGQISSLKDLCFDLYSYFNDFFAALMQKLPD